VMGTINLQHRCAHSKCTPNGKRVVRQERQESGVTLSIMNHTDDLHFVVNTFSLHNYKLISRLVHCHL
ncbi:hypothetical protein BDV93DRAFT_415140, partial [Ceratobasidium sp. AG-I]